MNTINVVKLDHNGREIYRYPGRELARDDRSITLEAFFSWGDTPVGEILLQRGDRFVETYFTDRWYNILEIYAFDTGDLKAYYCNIGFPAQITNGLVSYKDLAFDLLVLPDGRQFVLDEDEFYRLDIPEPTQNRALAGLKALQEDIKSKVSILNQSK